MKLHVPVDTADVSENGFDVWRTILQIRPWQEPWVSGALWPEERPCG